VSARLHQVGERPELVAGAGSIRQMTDESRAFPTHRPTGTRSSRDQGAETDTEQGCGLGVTLHDLIHALI
jgi:hypothetical protein